MNREPSIVFRGVYSSFESALAARPDTSADELSACGFTPNRRVRYAPGAGDHAPLFWLARLLPELGAVFEFRAGIGAKHGLYVEQLPALARVKWLVSAANDFDLQAASGSDLLLSSGALPFARHSLAELLAPIAQKPRYLLVNSTPLTRLATRYTLHGTGFSYRPYRVENEQSFLSGLARLGYDVVDHWQNPAKSSALSPELFEPVPRFHGFHLRLR